MIHAWARPAFDGLAQAARHLTLVFQEKVNPSSVEDLCGAGLFWITRLLAGMSVRCALRPEHV